MKPICREESNWLFWRNDNPNSNTKRRTGFAKWMKRMMNKAKRRYYKREINKNES